MKHCDTQMICPFPQAHEYWNSFAIYRTDVIIQKIWISNEQAKKKKTWNRIQFKIATFCFFAMPKTFLIYQISTRWSHKYVKLRHTVEATGEKRMPKWSYLFPLRNGNVLDVAKRKQTNFHWIIYVFSNRNHKSVEENTGRKKEKQITRKALRTKMSDRKRIEKRNKNI